MRVDEKREAARREQPSLSQPSRRRIARTISSTSRTNIPVTPSSTISGNEPRGKPMTGVPGEHRFDRDQPKRLFPIDRAEECLGAAQQPDLLFEIGFAVDGDPRKVKPRTKLAVEIRFVVFVVNPPGEHDGNAGEPRRVDGSVRPLLDRRNARGEAHSLRPWRRRRVLGDVDAMVDDGGSRRITFELELARADGDVKRFGVRGVDARLRHLRALCSVQITDTPRSRAMPRPHGELI